MKEEKIEDRIDNLFSWGFIALFAILFSLLIRVSGVIADARKSEKEALEKLQVEKSRADHAEELLRQCSDIKEIKELINLQKPE
jgi:hypothetical protein